MNQPNEGKNPVLEGKSRILVAPLDWGLGHATRCIPVIRELQAQGAEVWLAGEGAQETLLRTEFPELPFISLPGYRIRYGKSKWGLWKAIFTQVPDILKSIKRENKWLREVISKHGFDAVISDNRYGLYHPTLRCVFITHQLSIKSSWGENLLRRINYRYINRFASCWIPDEDNGNNLAGELSHPTKKPSIPVHYTGILSRFKALPVEEKKDHLLIVLSGPEPQRSILEDKIIRDISHYNGTATIVRGLPDSRSVIPSTNMINVYNHLPAKELNEEMMKAGYIISRSGYSTVMDIAVLKKKSILIPTPGQTEQEYLGKYLMQRKLAYVVSQNDFSLEDSLTKARDFSFQYLSFNDALLKITVEQFLEKL